MPTGSQGIPEIVAPILKLEESYERMWLRKSSGYGMLRAGRDYNCDYSLSDSESYEKEEEITLYFTLKMEKSFI